MKVHTKVFRYIASYRGKFLKLILTYLYSIKYNETNIYYLDIQYMYSLTQKFSDILHPMGGNF